MTRQYLIDLITGGVGALVLSAAARALPEPMPAGSRFYVWFYSFAHILLANFDKAHPQAISGAAPQTAKAARQEGQS